MLHYLQRASIVDISMKLNKTEVINLIKKDKDQFYLFEKVYIFGSILGHDEYSNDIDILLLYSSFSSEIIEGINEIEQYIEQKTFYPVDITALSFEEERDIGFINKLDKKYVCVK